MALAEELNISKEVQTKRSVRRINLVTYEAGCMATDRLLKLIERRAKMLAYDVPIKEEDAPVWHRPSEEGWKGKRPFCDGGVISLRGQMRQQRYVKCHDKTVSRYGENQRTSQCSIFLI